MASTAVRTWGTAVIRMTAMDSESARIRGSTTGPGSPRMRTSSSATSTRRDRMISSPAAPSAASRTSKSSLRMKRSDSRTPGSSSMTRTTGRDGYATVGGAPASAGPALSLEVGYREDDIFVAPSAALDIDGNDLARLHRGDDPPEALDIRHRLAIDLEDGVSCPDPGLVPGAAGRHLGDDEARLGGQLEPLAGLRRQGLDGEPEGFLPGLGAGGGLLAWLLADLDRERRRDLVADHDERRRAAGLHRRHTLLELRHVLDGRAVELHDDVPGLETGGLGRTVLHHVGDEDAAVLLHPEALGQLRRQLLDDDAQPAPHHPALVDELGHDIPRHVDRDREADPLPGGHHGGVDADHLALDVQERTAGV